MDSVIRYGQYMLVRYQPGDEDGWQSHSFNPVPRAFAENLLREMILENPSGRQMLQRFRARRAGVPLPLFDMRVDLEQAFEELISLVGNGGDGAPFVLLRREGGIDEAVTWDDVQESEGGAPELQETEQETKSEEIEKEEKLRDWKIECAHHASAASRAVLESKKLGVVQIEVVPDKGKTKDAVKIHWRDDWLGSYPDALQAKAAGQPPIDAKHASGEGGYHTYEFEAEYLGNVDITDFIFPSFWKDFGTPTTYSVGGDPKPTTFSVKVYHPRQFKFEFKLPPMKGFKAGAKLESEGGIKDAKAALKNPPKASEWSTEETSWSPSSLSLNTKSETADLSKAKYEKKDESKTAIAESIKLSVDGEAASIDIIQTISSLLSLVDNILKIPEAIRESVPKVGWYMDLSVQLMQGGLAVEWYWKEHTDHRVFQYIDVNISMTFLSIAFELGFGLSGLGFKAQIYANLSGAVSLELDGKRDDPSWVPGFKAPLKTTITGALGARFEAGNICKVDGKGETGLEFLLEFGVNLGDRAVYLDGDVKWTGIKASLTVSGGLFGIGASKKYEKVLVTERSLGAFDWPDQKPYKPPYVSKSRIKNILENRLTKGLNVRVFKEIDWGADEAWSVDRIAQALADKIAEDESFHRTEKMVEGLADSIRVDLDKLGKRVLRDWIEEGAFLSYVNGAGLQKHMENAINPGAALLAAAES